MNKIGTDENGEYDMASFDFVRTADGWTDAALAGGSRSWNKTGSRACVRRPVRFGGPAEGDLPTVRDFMVPPAVRFASAIARAAIVRDVAAFGAFVLFATMVAILLGLGDAGA